MHVLKCWMKYDDACDVAMGLTYHTGLSVKIMDEFSFYP